MALKLEVFETEEKPAGRTETLVMDTLALEEAKLASYDSGYQAGWEDAVAAGSDDQSRMRADLARNLQALSFTYHEARQHILRELEPLLTSVVERVLPSMARASLAPMILETLLPIAQSASSPPVTVVLNPVARPAVEALLETDPGLPVVLQDEPTLGEGQAYLRLQGSETQIDLDDAVQRIASAVRDFFALNGKEPKNG